MKIQVLGTGCAKCKQLTANAQAALAESGLAASVEKLSHLERRLPQAHARRVRIMSGRRARSHRW